MVSAISDCPGTEQNINIKGAMYNFQKVGVWVQVLFRVACEQAPSEPARSEKNSASEERDSASEASGTRGSL